MIGRLGYNPLDAYQAPSPAYGAPTSGQGRQQGGQMTRGGGGHAKPTAPTSTSPMQQFVNNLATQPGAGGDPKPFAPAAPGPSGGGGPPGLGLRGGPAKGPAWTTPPSSGGGGSTGGSSSGSGSSDAGTYDVAGAIQSALASFFPDTTGGGGGGGGAFMPAPTDAGAEGAPLEEAPTGFRLPWWVWALGAAALFGGGFALWKGFARRRMLMSRSATTKRRLANGTRSVVRRRIVRRRGGKG